MNIQIDPAAGKAWVNELEAGRHEQCSGHLKGIDGGYCCLGVFAEVQGATAEAQIEENEDDDGNVSETVYRYDFVLHGEDVNNDDLLDDDWAAKFEITPQHQNLFSSLNDGSNYTAWKVDHETAMFYPVIEALANDPTSYHGMGELSIDRRDDFISITLRKHTFFEIAQIIKTWFI